MEITEVRIRRANKEGRTKAVVSIAFDNEFVVHDIKIVEGSRGLFVAMPSRRTNDGDFRDIAHPISSETRERIKASIIEKYESLLCEDETAVTIVLDSDYI